MITNDVLCLVKYATYSNLCSVLFCIELSKHCFPSSLHLNNQTVCGNDVPIGFLISNIPLY